MRVDKEWLSHVLVDEQLEHGEVNDLLNSINIELAKADKKAEALQAALRLCVGAMREVRIKGDGRLDGQTQSEFRAAFEAAEKVGVE